MDRIAREISRWIKLCAAWAVARLSSRARAIREEGAWLIGGSVGRAYAGNSAALHRHICAHHPEIRTYWVIDRDSPDVEAARQVGPVLYRQDLWTYVYGLLARVHVVLHGVPTCSSWLSRRAFKVRLGHGLTALKRTTGSALRSVRAKTRVFDLVPVSSEYEEGNKLEWGIEAERLAVTGLPRFDELLLKSADARGPRPLGERGRILYVPTWRHWLPGDRQRPGASAG